MSFVIDKKTGEAKHVSDKYITADDLNGKEIKLVIEKVDSKLAETAARSEGIHVYFKGAKKPLLLNSTNARAIISLYGKKAAEWVGKEVTLHPSTTLLKGVKTACIRIKTQESENESE